MGNSSIHDDDLEHEDWRQKQKVITDLWAENARLQAELRHHAQDAVAKQTQFESLSVAHNEQCREVARLRERVAELESQTYAFRCNYACKVCQNEPDEHGTIFHGRDCYTQSEDGGGESYVELPYHD